MQRVLHQRATHRVRRAHRSLEHHRRQAEVAAHHLGRRQIGGERLAHRTQQCFTASAEHLPHRDHHHRQPHRQIGRRHHQHEGCDEPQVHQRQHPHPASAAHPAQGGDLGDHHCGRTEHEQHADGGVADTQLRCVRGHHREQEPERQRDGDVGAEQPHEEPVAQHQPEAGPILAAWCALDAARRQPGHDRQEHQVAQHVEGEQPPERRQRATAHHQAADHATQRRPQVECRTVERRQGGPFVGLHDQRHQRLLRRPPQRITQAEQCRHQHCAGERGDQDVARPGDDRHHAPDHQHQPRPEAIRQPTGHRGEGHHHQAGCGDGQPGLPQRDAAHLVEVDHLEAEQRRRTHQVDDRRHQEPLERGAERSEPGVGHDGRGYATRRCQTAVIVRTAFWAM